MSKAAPSLSMHVCGAGSVRILSFLFGSLKLSLQQCASYRSPTEAHRVMTKRPMQTSKLPNVTATLMSCHSSRTRNTLCLEGLPGAPLSSAFCKLLSVTLSSLATSLGPQATTIGGRQRRVRSLHLSFVWFLQKTLKDFSFSKPPSGQGHMCDRNGYRKDNPEEKTSVSKLCFK